MGHYHTRYLGSTDNPEGVHTHTKSTPKENKGMASPIRTMMIVTDASQAGWGAHLGDAKISCSCGQGGGGAGGCKTPYKHAGNEGGSDRAKEIHTAHHKPITV